MKYFKTDINLQGHQIIDWTGEQLTQDPYPIHLGEARLWWNKTEKAFKYYDGDVIRTVSDGLADNTVTDYRSSYEADGYIYSGFLFNTIPLIKRCKDGVDVYATGVTDLEPDWINRLILSYVP